MKLQWAIGSQLLLWSLFSCGDESVSGKNSGGAGTDDTSESTTENNGTSSQSVGMGKHDVCADIGDIMGMGAAIYGDIGTEWFVNGATSPFNIDWLIGYMYASGDPSDDPEGFEWIVNYRLDSIQEAGATLPMVTFYRMLNQGEGHGYTGSEAAIVQQMLQDGDAVHAYIDDFIALLTILAARETPTLVHVEPDSFGFMMWAFDGVDSSEGNGDATRIPVALSAAKHEALSGESFPDDAGGLGRAMLYLRDTVAPTARMGWHASNFRVGTKPEIVTSFYSSMGAWDVIVTEPPHMTANGSAPWDMSDTANQDNADWFQTVRDETGLPIIVWQTEVGDAEAYLGGWPTETTNMTLFADWGVVSVAWDPNAASCRYACSEADDLQTYLQRYAAAPLALPVGSVCRP